MGSKTYDPEEIRDASSKNVSFAEPDTAFFLGPTSESDQVFVFPNKLCALYFLLTFYEDCLSEEEKESITDEIDRIKKSLSDAETRPLPELVQNNDSLEVFAAGYWDDFILQTQPFWEEWIRNSADVYPGEDRLDYNEDEFATDDMISDEDENELNRFFYVEPPDDLYHPEFVETMMKIIPFA